MLALKYFLTMGGVGMIVVAAGILAYDLYREVLYRRRERRRRLRWKCAGERRWRWRCWPGGRCWWRSALW